jgi:hypothetical protein
MRRRLSLVLLPLAIFAGCGHSSPPQSAGGSVHPPGWGAPAPLSQRVPLFKLTAGTTATMYDTVSVSTVPHRPFAAAGYTAGNWPTFLPLRRAFPSAHVISIAIASRYYADCLDVEAGDAPASAVPGWVRSEMRAGWRKPCVYSDWWHFTHEVFPVLERAGIHRWQVWKWDADYTYRPHIDRGFDGTQYSNRCLGRNLDCSVVTRSFLAIAHPPLRPAPKPKPKPKPKPRPKPNPHREAERRHLRALEAEVVKIRRHLLNSGCRVKHPRPACKPLFVRGREVKREIRRLRGRGVRP